LSTETGLGPFDPAKPARANADTSFEIDLDDEPARREPVYVDVVTRDDELLPIWPAAWRGWTNIRASARRISGRWWHIGRWHAVRAPLHTAALAWFALIGALRLAGRLFRWWWHPELSSLMQQAVTAGDVGTGLAADSKLRSARLWRGIVVAAGAAAAAVTVPVALLAPPTWVQACAAAVLVVLLARAGRPGRPVLGSAVVAHRYRKLNSDIVLRAYYAAGLGHPDKPDQQIRFGSTLAREGDGSRVLVDLPYGRTFADALQAKPKIASGLDVSEFQVYLTRDRSSTRRHLLFVTDTDPLAIPAGRTPMLDLKVRDIWRPCFMGLDERSRRVELLLLWISVLVGAQPRKGKTYSARLLALYAALDPYVRITVADGKNSPDWVKFALVAHRMIFGTVANSRDTDPVRHFLDALYEIKAHVERVNDFLSGLPASECPEGKLTRELTRKYPHICFVWLLVVEEFQLYFETDDQDTNKEIAGLLSFIKAVGPSAGVVILSSSQKPSGVGAGDVQRLFNRYRDNHDVRFALKCGNRIVSEAVLGGDAYAEGYDASALPVGPEYRGIGYLYGASDDTPLVRCHLADAQDAERILVAARAHRERAGTLSGAAAGEDMSRLVRDVLADVIGVYRAGEAWISWQALADRMAEQMPEHYADLTKEAISAQVRALGAKEKKGRAGTASLWGVPRAEVEAAAKRREIGRAA
jgi:hypothetical protein